MKQVYNSKLNINNLTAPKTHFKPVAILLPPAGCVVKQSGIPSGEERLKGRQCVRLVYF